jgi:hypothetical protein
MKAPHTMPTRSQAEATNVSALLRARTAVIWIVTSEEARVEGYLAEAAAAAGYVCRFWDCGQGVTDLAGKPQDGIEGRPLIGGRSIEDTFAAIQQRSLGSYTERGVWVLRDLPPWISGPGSQLTLRPLRNLARSLPGTPKEVAQAIIVLTPSAEVPPELLGHVVVVEWPQPDRDEVAGILDRLVKAYDLNLNGQRDSCIDAAVGLSGSEVQAVYSKSLVQTKTIDPAVVSREKKRVIAKSGVLEWIDPLPGGLANVGGLDGVKTWIAKRACAFTAAARAFGLPALKGILLAGISGCGKSFTPKALAWDWRCPLVRLDFGALKGKFVGESEGRLRKALNTIDSLGPCIVLVDEIEKALAGATQGAADGGVSADALGTFLSWMNDRTSQAFVIATANDISSITSNAPELLRKGRFDEIFFVDTPTVAERTQIVAATLRSFKRQPDGIDLQAIAQRTDTFTGAELASLVPEALFTAFADGERELTTADLLQAAEGVVPLAQTASEKIASLRAWAKTRARAATTADKKVVEAPAQVLDID